MTVIQGSNRREIQKQAVRKDGWTKERRAIFLDELEASCNVTRAAKAAGMGQRSVRNLRRRDPAFAALWDEALDNGCERLRAELLARALGTAAPDAEDDNPAAEMLGTRAPEPMSDETKLRVLQICRAARDGRQAAGNWREPRRIERSAEEAVDALLAKLVRVEKRLGRTS